MREKISLTVLFVVSMATLGIEVLLTRVFSVVLLSSHSFLAISLTLLGSGAGAIMAYLSPKTEEDQQDRIKIYLLAMLALTVVVSFFTLLHVEFIPRCLEDPDTHVVNCNMTFNKIETLITSRPDLFNMWKLYGVVPIVFLPFLLAGYIQAFIFRHAPKRFSLYYGVDLLAATAGAVTLPLLLYPIGLAGTIATVVLWIALPAIYLMATRLREWTTAGVATAPVAIMAVLMALGGYNIKHPAGFSEDRVERQYWTPMSRVSLVKESDNRHEMYVIDNASRTLYAQATPEGVKRFQFELFNGPFELKAGGKALVIASGGGQELVMADHDGIKDIDAVEIAGPIVRDIVNAKKDDPGNPYLLPSVHWFIADGRSVVKRTKKMYDVIEMMEVNFHSLAGVVSQAWSPYFIFTQEAFAEYLSKLTPDGYLCYTYFSRGPSPVGGDKNCRFRSFVAGMHKAGIENPEDHFVSLVQKYGYGWRSMVMAKKSPFTMEELVKLMQIYEVKKGLEPTHHPEQAETTVLQYPDLRPAVDAGLMTEEQLRIWEPDRQYFKPVRDMCRNAKPLEGLLANIKTPPSFNTGTNDDRPFMYGSGFRRINSPQETMIRNLYRDLLIIMFVLAIIFVALPFLVRQGDSGQSVRLDPRLFLILVCTGLGFMFVEMAGIYKYQLYMKHPTIALVVILSGMILGAGLGSMHSGRIAAAKGEASIAFYALASAVGSALLLVAAPIYAHGFMLWLPLEGLLPVAFVAFAALGFLLGHVVPLSIATYAADQERLLAWCWAITVTGSVFGTVTASILSRDYGMFLVAAVGIACYLIVATTAAVGRLAAGAKGNVM
jgi:hypothetical protein